MPLEGNILNKQRIESVNIQVNLNRHVVLESTIEPTVKIGTQSKLSSLMNPSQNLHLLLYRIELRQTYNSDVR